MDAVMGTAQASLVPGILNQLLWGVGKSGTAMEREMETIVKREESDAMRESMPRSAWLDALIILLTLAVSSSIAQMAWGLLSQFSDIILYFVLAGLVAFALDPLVERVDNQPLPSGLVKRVERLFGNRIAQKLARYRVPRVIAVASVYVALTLALIAFIAVFIPPVVQQLYQIAEPGFTERISRVTQELLQAPVAIGLRSTDVGNMLSGALGSLQNLVGASLLDALSILGRVVNLAGNLLLVLFFSYFFALDGPRLVRGALDLVPRQYDEDIRMLTTTVDRVLGGYIRSTFLQAFLVGAGTAAVMRIFGQPYLLIAGLFAGFFMLIPLVGTALALVSPVLVALSSDPGQAPVIFILLLVYQLLVVNVVMPKLMSEALGMHPLMITASLLIGVKIGGFWGAFFAIPLAAMIATMGLFLYRRLKRNHVSNPDGSGHAALYG